MMHRLFLCSLLAAVVAPLAPAQNAEAQLNERNAKTLNAFAKKAFDKGFPSIAKTPWMQVIKLYDKDNAEAWTGLGYYRQGEGWNPDPNHPYPAKDTGSGSDGKPLEAQYDKVKKELAQRHKQMALDYAKAELRDQANLQWQRVLLWSDDDEEAKQALQDSVVEGLSGSGHEAEVFERSKDIEKAVEEQSKIAYPVEIVTGIECAPLELAQVPYITVKSEHFVLHGKQDDEQEKADLQEALQWAERALRVCQVAFPWKYDEGPWPAQWAFFPAKETYQQILKANKVPDLEWRLENTSTCGIGNTVVAATSGKQVLFDACVRNVARPYSGFATDGYSEGIGHTFVGMIFQNNRLFSVDLKKQEGTAASEEDRAKYQTDFDVWKDLALDQAWRLTGGVEARELPFCDAATFTNDQRIKAWSFSDYMMRRDPGMLRGMDQIAQQMKAQRNKQPDEFERLFAEKFPGTTIAGLDKEWQDFWTGASPTLRAIRNNTPPVSAISKGVDKWLELLNEERKKYGRTAVTFAAKLSGRCKEHAEYLKKNKDERGPAAEHTQKVDLGGSYAGSLFAQVAIVEVGANPGKAKKMFEKWVYLPGYRDFFINHAVQAVGMYVEGDILVVNATSGFGKPSDPGAGFDCYPPRNDTNLIFDREVAVADLGPEAEELLKRNGREGQKTIGFPLTMHFGTTGGIDLRGSLDCKMRTAKGEEIEGELVFDGGTVRTTSAPGMATFWPLDPLPKGKVEFQWSWSKGSEQGSIRGAFSAK